MEPVGVLVEPGIRRLVALKLLSPDCIRKAIGAELLEMVPIGKDHTLFVDEEGRMKGKPHNSIASDMYKRHTGVEDKVVGKAVFLHNKYIKELMT